MNRTDISYLNRAMKLKENKLAAPTAQWLESQGYTVYSEVSSPYSGASIDIVGINNNEKIVAVELKMCLTKEVICQAKSHYRFAQKTFVCVVSTPISTSIGLCKKYNIGVLSVTNNKVVCLLDPNNYNAKLIERLKNMIPGYEHAGKPCLKGIGPAQEVLKRIKEYLVKHPEAKWKELYNNIPNHYASYGSMQSSMRTWNKFTLAGTGKRRK